MIGYRLSNHAIKQISDREIPIELLEQVVNTPEQVIRQDDRSKIYQSKFIGSNYKTYLLRVFVNDSVEPITIISVYLTSKVTKYWE
ncbi:DUF4258 domain-containing protein [Pseudanabaena mucicola]|uniref:DUF4258 domain-containing protein n=1 Tax=Pseudanabaena mucicola FACHB-723 TaxID=2692860 RepID=A0ABR7ZVP7_9CYAN|nr:DUF4258 domain-containing protein [Pseudanabaena mucicola FACHB-723]